MSFPLVIEAADLAQHLNDPNLLIIDLSDEETYNRGHIPGAVRVDTSRLMLGSGPVPNKLPTAAQLSDLFSELGLTEETQVVTYDNQMGPWAGRMIWTLNLLGHERCSFLNGQLKAWTNAGLTLETTKNTSTEVPFRATINTDYLADIAFIKQHLRDSQNVIWDARSGDEYRGAKIINAQKGGHIPGARLYEWTQVMISTDDTRLRPAHEIQAELDRMGISTDKEVITHCQTHRRSGLTYLVAKHLGFKKVRCYDGSWFEWGNQPDTPVEQ